METSTHAAMHFQFARRVSCLLPVMMAVWYGRNRQTERLLRMMMNQQGALEEVLGQWVSGALSGEVQR